MRCDCCPLSDPEDVCPEAEGQYGLTHKDGVLGCTHPRNWVKKRDEKYAKHLSDMGCDMGVEMTLTPKEIFNVTEICKHMLGLDYHKPYHRRGKAFYRFYRNYYKDGPNGNQFLDKLPKFLVQRDVGTNGVTYVLTKDGIEWLGRQLNIKIMGWW